MTLEDLPDVLKIEQVSFPLPFSQTLFQTELKLDIAHLYVAKERSSATPSLIGYIDFWDIGSEIHLINIATHPDWRRKGVGGALLDFLIKYAHRHRTEEITLDVRPSNTAAVSLYEKFGFKEIGRRKKYYQDNDEDAIVMRRT